MIEALLFVTVGAIAGSLLLTPVIIGMSRRFGLVSLPGKRRIHARPVPRMGGVAVFAGTCAGLLVAASLAPIGEFALLTAEHLPFSLALCIGGALMFVTGVIDDAVELRVRAKLLAQLLAAVSVYALGFRIEMLSLGLPTDLALGWLGLPLTVLWIVGVTNAYNLIDGLDGLASGIALVALGATAAAAAVLGRPEVLLVTVALFGALVGFLPYNFNPARIFLGDSGSLFVGFMIAVLSVHGSMKSTTAVLAVVPLLALAVPLIDLALSVTRRWLRGLPVAGADARHIHHRLMALGLTHRRVVVLLYAVAAGLATLGLLLAFTPPAQIALVTVFGGTASAALVVVGLRGLNYDELLVASQVLASGPRRVRRVIRDRIHAHDVTRILETASTKREIVAVLCDQAEEFGFLHMQVCPERSSDRDRFETSEEPWRRVWKLDYPLAVLNDGEDQMVLRIWCRIGQGARPYGAERVAHVLGPALESALNRVASAHESLLEAADTADEARKAALAERRHELERELEVATRPRSSSAGMTSAA